MQTYSKDTLFIHKFYVESLTAVLPRKYSCPIAETNVAINTFNLASGIGKRYNADSSSIAIVKGLGFYIAPKELFKFDFNGLTTLGAESTSSRENAFARSKTRIVIYTTDSHGTQTPIDRLLISTRQTAKGSELNLKASMDLA